MVRLIVLLAGLPYSGPVREPVPGAGAVLISREVYVLTLDSSGRPRPRPVAVGVDEWSERRK